MRQLSHTRSLGHPIRNAPTFLACPPALLSTLRDDGAAPGRLSFDVGDSWASMVNTPLLPISQKSLTGNNSATGHTQTVDPAVTKLNDLYGGASPAVPPRATCTTAATAYTVTTAILSRARVASAPGVGRVQNGSLRGLRNVVLGPVCKASHSQIHLVASVEATTVLTRWLPHINKPRWWAWEWASVGSNSDWARPGRWGCPTGSEWHNSHNYMA